MDAREYRKVVSELKPLLNGAGDFSAYQFDPVGFGEVVLGHRYTEAVKKLMLSVAENEITVGKSANAVGKTHAAAALAVWFYKTFPGAQVYTAAAPPEGNLRRLLWGEIGEIVRQNSEMFAGDRIIDLHIERSPKEFLTGVTIPASGTASQREAKFSGKHAPYILFILDEGDAIPDEVYKAVETCMSGGHVRLLILFNPRVKAGEVYRMERDEKARIVTLSALNHPNVVLGADIIPGAVSRETTVRRINEYCRHTPDAALTENSFELPSHLEGASAFRRNGDEYPPLLPGVYQITEPAFSYMTLARYPAVGSAQLISWDWIAEARARYDAYIKDNGIAPPRNTDAVMGLDVAEFGADSNAACFRYDWYVTPLVIWSGVDVIRTADRAAVEYQIRRTARCNVDGTGVGAGVAPYMQRLRKCRAHSIKVASRPTTATDMGEFAILRDQMWWACREWLRTNPQATLPPDEQLCEELAVATYSTEGGKVKIMKKDTMKELLKRSPDRADALCLTFAPNMPEIYIA